MLVKQCNNREEAVTEGFPWEFMKPEEKQYTDIVLSSLRGEGHPVFSQSVLFKVHNNHTPCYQYVLQLKRINRTKHTASI